MLGFCPVIWPESSRARARLYSVPYQSMVPVMTVAPGP